MSEIRSILLASAAFAILLSGAGMAVSQGPDPVRPASVEALKKKIRELEHARAEHEKLGLRWEEAVRAPLELDARNRGETALIELVHEASAMPCVWTFRPVETGETGLVRACQDHPSREWIRLDAGSYDVEQRVGLPDGRSISLAPRRVRLRPRTAYRLTFGAAEQRRIQKETDRQRAKAKSGSKTP